MLQKSTCLAHAYVRPLIGLNTEQLEQPCRVLSIQPQEVVRVKLAKTGGETVLKTKTIGEVNEKQDTTLLCAGSRCVFNWRYRVRFNERFHNWHLSVEQLGCTERRCAVRHLDWLQAVAQCRAQQLCVVSRFPLQMTQQHRSTLLATFITTILNRAADIIND